MMLISLIAKPPSVAWVVVTSLASWPPANITWNFYISVLSNNGLMAAALHGFTNSKTLTAWRFLGWRSLAWPSLEQVISIVWSYVRVKEKISLLWTSAYATTLSFSLSLIKKWPLSLLHTESYSEVPKMLK
jgi:hypothetical protein